MVSVAQLYRYPIKGLSPEPLEAAELETSGYFPGDRLYAIENGPSRFNAVAPRHLPKIVYLMLMRNEALARLETRFDHDTQELTIAEGGREVLRASLATEAGREAVAAFLKRFLPHELRGEPRVLSGPPGYAFTDAREGYVSLINLASVAAIEELVGAPVDPLRFRANIYVSGLQPWAELKVHGHILEAPSGLNLRITYRTERCAATNVDPQTGLRDLAIPHALARHLGHIDCGVYAEIIAGGALRTGDTLKLTPC